MGFQMPTLPITHLIKTMIPIPNLYNLCRHKSLVGLFILAIATFYSPELQAQVAVQMKMNKSSYILNEPVTATVYITNNTGANLTLRGTPNKPWLMFSVSSASRDMSPARRINYRPIMIPPGQTNSTTVSISSSYSLGLMGNYTCRANVVTSGNGNNFYSSNRCRFNITNGRPIWKKRVGVPGSPGKVREYKILSFSGNQTPELYAQVSSVNQGFERKIATVPLGKGINFGRIKAELDGANNLHTIYQTKPNMFTHLALSPYGKVISIEHHKRGATGDPRFVKFGDGSIRVAGSIPYNAEQEAQEVRKIRNISERPNFIYRH